jgi:hypothetical protein
MDTGHLRIDSPYPMVRLCHRTLEPSYEGPVFVWDIDKTYLDTRFERLRDLVAIPFELGVDKHAFPGTAPLLHGLRAGPDGREHRPLFFVSASPHQIHAAIERKMLIDGVGYDGITYKDPLRVLMRGQPRQLKEQMAFKLSALSLLYEELPRGAKLFLFGDDAEQDTLIYCLFADIAAGRLRDEVLKGVLQRAGVRSSYADAIADLARTWPAREAVGGIYIHLVRCGDGSSIAGYEARVIGWPTPVAAAAELHAGGFLSAEALERVREISKPSETISGAAEADPAGHWTPAQHRLRSGAGSTGPRQ